MSTPLASSPIKQFFASKTIRGLVKNKKFSKFAKSNTVQFFDRIINNSIMIKLRQRQCRDQKPNESLQDYLKTHFCSQPFRTLETTHTNMAFVCCPVWLPTPIGTLHSAPEEIWNGPVAKDIRRSIIDGSFRHCNHLHCAAITNRILPHRDSEDAQRHIREFETDTAPRLPTNVNLSHDKSCNLSCPSCRSDLYLANKSKQESLDALTDRFVLPLLKNTETVMITGSGDPFGSRHFRNLIKKITPEDYPKLRFDLLTNGQLLNKKAWDELNLAGRVANVHISVDAARSETYKIVRRGGTFERLRDNLKFVRDLRLNGDIKHLEFSMVVQQLNFREMPAFIALAKDFAVDEVHFQMIRQRDIFSLNEYEEAFIGNADHAEYAEFLKVIRSEELRSLCSDTTMPRVEMGNVLAYIDESYRTAPDHAGLQ